MAVTRTPIVPNPGIVSVNPTAGEFLHFTLDAGGPIPGFVFNSNIKGNLFEATDFLGHPLPRYEWEHLKNPSDIQQFELLDLALLFFTNADYTYTVELRSPHAMPKQMLQIKWTGGPTDHTSESFRVVIT